MALGLVFILGHDSAASLLGAAGSREDFQVPEMREDGSLGAGTCLSLINHHLFPAGGSGGADILGSPWVASLPACLPPGFSLV